MKIDASLPKNIDVTRIDARAIEEAGYDGLWVEETRHDPFLQVLQALQATESVTVGTSIAVAFARTPMTMAGVAYDLARHAHGRFVLGLGSQVRPHVEKRFSMPWSSPAARMREFILALKAIWTAWQEDSMLDFRGDFYTHTLMTPFFSPPPHPAGPPPVYLAGVGVRMTEVAGEVADGFFVHPLTTRRYLDEVTLPALARGRARAGLTMDGFAVVGPSFVAVGRDERELEAAVAGTRRQIAFYASTPVYRPMLELHGWGDLQSELTRLSKEGRWEEMGGLVDDDMLNTVALVGEPAKVGPELVAKLGDVQTRTTFYTAYDTEPALISELLAHTRKG